MQKSGIGAVLAGVLGMWSGLAMADGGSVTPVGAGAAAPYAGRIDPAGLIWRSPPGLPLSAAWALGAEAAPGLYLLRVRLAAGGRIPPHTHPDTRVSTVLSGTLRVGLGEDQADDAMLVIGPGESVVVPAGQMHRVWAKDGPVDYQEAGAGPSATHFAAP